jgi:hypothetical protein
MEELIGTSKVVNEFLTQVKDRMPVWIRWKEKEYKCIINELELHIWEKAIDNAHGIPPNISHLQLAIAEMGSPESITSEYVRKSTPKLYITKELLPYYLKSIKNLVIVTILLHLFIIIWPIFGQFLLLVFTIDIEINPLILYIVAFHIWIILTILFIIFSKEGYQPSHFKDFFMGKKLSVANNISSPLESKKFWKLAIFWAVIGLVLLFSPIGFFGIWLLMFSIINFIRAFVGNKNILRHEVLIFISILVSLVLINYLHRFSNPQPDEYFLIYFFDFLSFEEIIIFSDIFRIIGQIIITPIYLGIFYKIFTLFTLRKKYYRFQKYRNSEKISFENQEMDEIINKSNNNGFNDRKNLNLESSIRHQPKKNLKKIDLHIKRFLIEVEGKLPLWLKDRELRIFINDLENHIIDKLIEISQNTEPTLDDLNMIFNEIGKPSLIVQNYKKQGSPKLYISKELWNPFIITIKLIVFVMLFDLSIKVILGFIQMNLNNTLSGIILIDWLILLILLSLSSIIYAILSGEGFIPKKLRQFKLRKEKQGDK